MRRRAGSLAWALLVSCTAAIAHAACPLNQGVIGVIQNCAAPQSAAPVYSFSSSGCFNGDGSVSYDLVNGTIQVSSFSRSHEGFRSFMQASDDYVITGPPSTTAIGISVVCTATLADYRSGIQLTSGPLSVSTLNLGGGVQTLRMFLAKLPGEPFSVSMNASASAAPDPFPSGSSVRGELRFSGLSAGYMLTSCQGYAALPVGTRTSSWGRVKQFYR